MHFICNIYNDGIYPERVAALCGAVLPVLETIEGYSKSVALIHIAEVEAVICMQDKQVALKENINGKVLKKCSLNSY